jgi:lipopolysaccharide heptosyltransferase II
MNKITLLKTLDKLVGTRLIHLLEKKRPPKSSRSDKILMIRPGGIGDAVLLIPAIQALRESYPNASIDMLCEKRNLGIFSLSDHLKTVYCYDQRFQLIHCLRQDYDIVIDTEQWHRLSIVAGYLTNAPVRVGFATNDRQKLLTHPVPYNHDDYEVYSFLRLIEALTANVFTFDFNKPFIRAERETIKPAILSEIDKAKGDMLAIFPGASVVERQWGGANFGKLAKLFSDQGYQMVVIGAKNDSSVAQIIKSFDRDCMDLTGRTTLKEVASILTLCRALITADSGLMHIAYGVGTPTASLFGSGIQKKWAPLGQKHVAINKRLVCSPCTKFGYTPQCPKNIECLSQISVQDVKTAVEAILYPLLKTSQNLFP